MIAGLAAALNVLLGLAYVAVGTVVLIDVRRQRGNAGNPLGYALVAMAYTCGPHHLEHGLHLAEGSLGAAGPLDLITVLVGLPPAALFALLTIEGFRGGVGDRLVGGTPRWLSALGLGGAAYATVFAAAVVERLPDLGSWQQVMVPNLLLVGIYVAVAVVILSTQVLRRPVTGTWSVGGLSLGLIFATCAPMHATWVLYGALGRYEADVHLAAIDWLAVPAGLYFLWVVNRLRTRALRRARERARPLAV